jgi:hypothetical protein
MKLTRRRINSTICALLLASTAARGDQLVRLDDPSIVVALRPSGFITGYYAGRSDESYLFGRDGTTAICKFLFYGTKRPNGYEIKGWETSLVPAAESRIARGAIYIGYTDDANEWVLQFDEAPNGCRSRKDGERLLWHHSNYFMERDTPILYKEEQGVHARVIKRLQIVGIRVVQSNVAPVFSVHTAKFTSNSSFSIAQGGLVTAIQQDKDYTYVEHLVPKTGEKLSGWIQTKHLKDPFTK